DDRRERAAVGAVEQAPHVVRRVRVDVEARGVDHRARGVRSRLHLERRRGGRPRVRREARPRLEWHMTDSLLVSRDGPRLTLTLNRPEAGNTLDLGLAVALVEALDARESASARVVVIRGTGK